MKINLGKFVKRIVKSARKPLRDLKRKALTELEREVREYTEQLVLWAETKLAVMSGPKRKRQVLALLRQRFPDAPAFLFDVAIEAAVRKYTKGQPR